jgi:hypothetical protein
MRLAGLCRWVRLVVVMLLLGSPLVQTTAEARAATAAAAVAEGNPLHRLRPGQQHLQQQQQHPLQVPQWMMQLVASPSTPELLSTP